MWAAEGTCVGRSQGRHIVKGFTAATDDFPDLPDVEFFSREFPLQTFRPVVLLIRTPKSWLQIAKGETGERTRDETDWLTFTTQAAALFI